MNFHQKYLKYKTKYLSLKNQNLIGGVQLKYHNISKTEYTFKLNKFVDIAEGTDAIFINNSMIVISRLGGVYNIDNYKTKPSITKIKDMTVNPNFTSNDTELGLVGIANISDKIYLSYTVTTGKKNKIDLIISEYVFDQRDLKLTYVRNIFVQTFDNNYHHGGHLVVSADNKLYTGLGDGGPQGDPENHGQNINDYRGKLLLIDPDTTKVTIKALGLRNPWLFSLDSENRMWIGDVGWNTSESVKLIIDLDKVSNFGWSIYEGSVHVPGKPKISSKEFDQPIWEYRTGDRDGRSVIGGFFIDNLGIYVFADFLGFVRAIKFNVDQWELVGNEKLDTEEKIYALAYDNSTIYVLTDKQIYSLEIISLQKN